MPFTPAPAAVGAAHGSSTAARSAFVAGLSLKASQLGEATGAGGTGRSSWRRAGTYGMLMRRLAAEVASEAQLMLVRHRILGPSPPAPDALRSAIADAELPHLILVTTEVHSVAPLAILTCDVQGDAKPSTADAAAASSPPASPAGAACAAPSRSSVRVVMQKACFERAAVGVGRRFVVFGSFIERPAEGGQRLIIPQHVEALPLGTLASDPCHPGQDLGTAAQQQRPTSYPSPHVPPPTYAPGYGAPPTPTGSSTPVRPFVLQK